MIDNLPGVVLAVALAWTMPCAAAAQEEAAPPPSSGEAAGPRWTLGGGVGWGGITFLTTSHVASSLSGTVAGLTTVSASLERRVGERTWLAVGLSGSLERQRGDVAAGGSGISQADVDLLSVSAGLRRPLTPPGAPVEVSLLALLDAGVVRDDQHGLVLGASDDFTERAWLLGASLGLAVDRELTSGLVLRVAASLVQASYAETQTTATGQPTTNLSDFSLAASIAPRLELRLAF